jgi:hypothetical protein
MPVPGFVFDIIIYTGTRTGEFASNTVTAGGQTFTVGYNDVAKKITLTRTSGYADFVWTQTTAVDVEACQTTTVNVNIATTGPINAAELKLEYDATRLELVSATNAGTGISVALNTSTAGTIYQSVYWQGAGISAGEGFLTLVFKGIRDNDDNTGSTGSVAPIEIGQSGGTRIMNNFGFVGGSFEPLVSNVLTSADTLALNVTPDVTAPAVVCGSLDGDRFVNSGTGYLVSGTEFDAILSATDACITPTITHNAAYEGGTNVSGDNTSLAGWIFPVGVHTITFTATDGFNTSTCTVVITVNNQVLNGTAVINMGCNADAPVRVTILDGTTVVDTFISTLAANGTYSVTLTGVPAGTYNVSTKVDRYLSKLTSGINFASQTAPSYTITQVIPGDIAGATFGDNLINGGDLSLLIAAYNTSSSGGGNYNGRANLNCDGFVDAIDISFISFYYGLQGQ